MQKKVNVFWFRRDLRLDDNVGFLQALSGEHPVLPVFIFDRDILDQLPSNDARVSFIYDQLQQMRQELQQQHSSSIAIYHGKPKEIFQQLIDQYDIAAVFTNHDYEPYARERDMEIENLLSENHISFRTFKDQVIFEKDEVVKKDGEPYLVYTPYMKVWKAKLSSLDLKIHTTSQSLDNLIQDRRLPVLTLGDMGFKASKIKVPDYKVSPSFIEQYEKTRDYPGVQGTSRLGPHLRFGTVSPRKMVKKAAAQNNKTFLEELIWREFFMQILYHHPHTQTYSFKKKYDRIQWRNKEEEFQKWKSGKTGFPLVDAGMRQLNETGFMHNRVRMLVGSFLCKHLLIDWRWGEAYFAEKLLDYEMASNLGNWQWVAGSGVDAAPYFRIFNPTTQLDKFDKDKKFIKKWIQEYGTKDYPDPMVDHKKARERALAAYKKALDN
ncbi:cryptochrome/photolyase family protein [Salegentibacter sp. F14]